MHVHLATAVIGAVRCHLRTLLPEVDGLDLDLALDACLEPVECTHAVIALVHPQRFYACLWSAGYCLEPEVVVQSVLHACTVCYIGQLDCIQARAVPLPPDQLGRTEWLAPQQLAGLKPHPVLVARIQACHRGANLPQSINPSGPRCHDTGCHDRGSDDTSPRD